MFYAALKRDSQLQLKYFIAGPVLFPENDPDSCTTPSDAAGLCVEIKFCPPLKRVSLNNLRKYICGFQVLALNVFEVIINSVTVRSSERKERDNYNPASAKSY